MRYQTIILSESDLDCISLMDVLSQEGMAEVRRALQVFKDEDKLKANRVKLIPISKGFVAGKNI